MGSFPDFEGHYFLLDQAQNDCIVAEDTVRYSDTVLARQESNSASVVQKPLLVNSTRRLRVFEGHIFWLDDAESTVGEYDDDLEFDTETIESLKSN